MIAGARPTLLPLLALLAATPAPAQVERTLLLSERTAVVEMRTAALVMSGQEGGELPIAVAAVPDDAACGDDGDCAFSVLVEIDGATLLASDPGDGGLPVDVFAYVLGTELDVLEMRSLSLDLDLRRQRELLEPQGLKVFLRLDVPPGDHALRVLAQAGDAFGLRGLDLPAGPESTATVPVAVLYEVDGPWLVVAPAGVEMPLPSPFDLETGHLPATSPRPVDGARIADTPIEPGGTALDDPGRPAANRAERRMARDAAAAYTRALRQLAAGETEAARSTLMASEESVVGALGADAAELLVEIQSRILASIPEADWGAALPAMLLHLEASRAYRDAGQPILTFYATRMTADLADAYARKLDDPRARAEAARVLASLAGYLQQKSALAHAERLFERALDLAEDDPAALLGLATVYEKRGLSARAVPVLEKLHAARPGHAEGTLRLGLNRARAGRLAGARSLLARLAARGQDDWITLLAHQELARLAIDDGRTEDAEELLRRGLARWPDQPTLQLQLAWVLDARGEIDASLELLEGLGAAPAPSASDHPAAERSRYNRWPTDLLAGARRQLDEDVQARRPELARWLETRGTADEG